jgi:hypothetical protein
VPASSAETTPPMILTTTSMLPVNESDLNATNAQVDNLSIQLTHMISIQQEQVAHFDRVLSVIEGYETMNKTIITVSEHLINNTPL